MAKSLEPVLKFTYNLFTENLIVREFFRNCGVTKPDKETDAIKEVQ